MINRILLYNSGGGVGDALQMLPLINGLKDEFKNADFFYLCAHENHFNSSLNDLNCQIKTLKLNIKYFGFRWWHIFKIKNDLKSFEIKKFDLIIDLQSKIRNSLILKKIPHNFFISSCFNFKLSKPSLKIQTRYKKVNADILNAINLAFDIKAKLIDYNTNKISSKFIDEAYKLLPKDNYVGFSITQGNVYRKKEWPLTNIIKVAHALKAKNKTPVFFVHKKDSQLKNRIQNIIPFAKFPEHETELSSPALVICLAKRLDFVISIDNGIMHMIELAKVPMILLFGPTSSEKFAPNHKNITILDSKKLYRTKDISSITTDDVLEAAKQYLDF